MLIKRKLRFSYSFNLRIKTEAKIAFRDYIRDSCALLKKG